MKTKRTRTAPSGTSAPLRSATAGVGEILARAHDAAQSESQHERQTAQRRGVITASKEVAERVSIVEAELLAPLSFPEINFDLDALISAFLDSDGALRTSMKSTPSLAAAAVGDIRLLDRTDGLERLRAAAFAKNTLSAYGHAVRSWQQWCRNEKRDPLPLDPAGVTAHLLDTCFERDEKGFFILDSAGDLIPRCSLSTASLRLAGLNKLADFLRIPRPGENTGVKEVMRGIRRCLGVQVERRAPLDLDDLDRCCVAADGSTFDQARARALLLTRARTGATAGQLAKLTWADIALAADEVVIDLPADHSSQRRRTVVVPRHANPNLCLVNALTHLRRVAPRLDAVFSTASGGAMDRTSVYRNLLKQARGSGWSSLAGMTDRQLDPLLATPGLHTRLETARTRAVLLVGFWTAARRSNLAALNWRDVTDLGDDGWRVVWRRSKTDQEGQGFTIYLPQFADEADRASCPSYALRELLAAETEALGRPPRPSEPVFWRLTTGGTPELTLREARPARISGKSINVLVQRVVVDAGLTKKPKKGQKNPFGGHSLRMGFVTEALRDDKLNVGEVADVTGHRSYDVLMRYRNEINAAKNAPGKKLAQKMGRGR